MEAMRWSCGTAYCRAGARSNLSTVCSAARRSGWRRSQQGRTRIVQNCLSHLEFSFIQRTGLRGKWPLVFSALPLRWRRYPINTIPDHEGRANLWSKIFWTILAANRLNRFRESQICFMDFFGRFGSWAEPGMAREPDEEACICNSR